MIQSSSFESKKSIQTKAGAFHYHALSSLSSLTQIEKLPYSIRILLENSLRNMDGFSITEADVRKLAGYQATAVGDVEIPFKPARVILQDFTGVPAVVDLAALRSALHEMGGDPQKINPLVPVDLVIDHSIQVDAFGSDEALSINERLEFNRNAERYKFLKWGQKALKNFRAVPPSTGIVHQVNLEYLAQVVFERDGVLFPDTLVGTDSHTTMINGLGVLGWGVGGIEAEAVMLGQPIYMLMPEVVGFKLTGELEPGATATDLVLTITEMLRKHGVVGKFVEFFGQGMASLTLANRATIANMAPEYGATMGFFPVDDRTLEYCRMTGRSEELIDTIERYTKENYLWRTDQETAEYGATLELDLGSVQPSLAGPKRPQDRILLSDMKGAFAKALTADTKSRGFGLKPEHLEATSIVADSKAKLKHGSVVLAAITSCTNTSNPYVLVGAGLLAKKAVEHGLQVPPYVKTSLAPGSRVVTSYLEKLGLDQYLEKLGFFTVGYGCTTCIGNSGPLPDPVREAIHKEDLVVASVLSGNRNFEGRISPDIKANFLASPPLVVAYAIAGTVIKDLSKDPIGTDPDGNAVYLQDIWPSAAEVEEAVKKAITPQMFTEQYQNVFQQNELWNAIPSNESDLYDWDEHSTYVQNPPFFTGMSLNATPIQPLQDLRVLAKLGDSVTTDHISPAGVINADSPAGRYLLEKGVSIEQFNSYGSRRGNDRIMTRGTFANIRLRNHLANGKEGGFTKNFLDQQITSIYEASVAYKTQGIGLMVIGGKEYGTGSSRDWAAKGTFLLGVKAVLAESFERIHRSNLVGMGVLPLQFKDGENSETLGLSGEETFSLPHLTDQVTPKQVLDLLVKDASGTTRSIEVIARLDTPVEIEYYRNGGILHTVLRQLAKQENP